MSNAAEMRESIRNLLDSQRLAVLSTQRSGRPYSNLIAFVAADDLKDIFFATSRDSRKYVNLTANPWVSLLMDNRSNTEADFTEAEAVTVLGTAVEALDPEREGFLQIYLKKHPYLEKFVAAPNCALIRVKVEKYLMVTRFQEVREIYLE